MIDKPYRPAVDKDDCPVFDDDDVSLTEPEVKKITKLSKPTRWRLQKKGRFPPLILGRFQTVGQIREWKAQERERAEADAKAALAKSEMPPKRGRPRKETVSNDAFK